jgi:3-keto-disaccharide hydrolase
MRILVAASLLACAGLAAAEQYPQHDRNRPAPKVVAPGPALSAPAPADAVVLFDGKDLSQWRSQKDKGAAAWKIADGAFEVVKGTGGIETARSFGDCQLHIEWASPNPPVGTDQDRGNSGVFFMGIYELQVLDSYQAATYPDGQAGALYGQFPPLVNVSRAPGEWNAYDVVFRAPRFDRDGKLLKPARVTAFQNGVLIQDAQELLGPTTNKVRTPYSAHADKLPLSLQDHGHPVRFRNVWIRELPE